MSEKKNKDGSMDIDMTALSHSPTIYKEEEKKLSFFEALKAVKEGKKITKLEWNDKQVYGFLYNNNNNILCLHQKNGEINSWILNDGDLLGNDWIIL